MYQGLAGEISFTRSCSVCSFCHWDPPLSQLTLGLLAGGVLHLSHLQAQQIARVSWMGWIQPPSSVTQGEGPYSCQRDSGDAGGLPAPSMKVKLHPEEETPALIFPVMHSSLPYSKVIKLNSLTYFKELASHCLWAAAHSVLSGIPNLFFDYENPPCP